MIVTLTGINDYARHRALRVLIEEFVALYGEFGLERIQAADTELGRLLESVSSMPFLSARRMIILSDPSTNKALVESIEQFLSAVSEATDVVIVERKFDKRLTLYKTLKKHTDLREYTDLDGHALADWLVEEAKARGGTLSKADASYIIDRAGLNQMALSNELDKLLLYDPEITRKTIEMLIEPLPQSTVFELLDAAFNGNKKRSIALYEDQRRQQVEPQAIMGMISWQVHILAVVGANKGSGAETIATSAKLNPFVVRKTLNIAKHLTREQIRELVEKTLTLDVRLKSESIDADDALMQYLLTIDGPAV